MEISNSGAGTPCPYTLQFGHGCGAVEMKPGQDFDVEIDIVLQFGHGCGAVEIGIPGTPTSGVLLSLQFGHGCGAVEILEVLYKD